MAGHPYYPVIAHRGASAYAPENTLAAMRLAKGMGVNVVEFDVMLSADKRPVIFHDDKLDRTTPKLGRVSDFRLCELQQFDAGSWFSPEHKEQRIVSLVDMLHCLVELDMQANIEIKPQPGEEVETAFVTCEAVKSFWPAEQPQPIFSSFSLVTTKTVRDCLPDARLGLLLESKCQHALAVAKQLECEAIHLSNNIATQAYVQSFKQAGYAVFVYTVNKTSRAKQLFSYGVDAVFSDYPDRIIQAA